MRTVSVTAGTADTTTARRSVSTRAEPARQPRTVGTSGASRPSSSGAGRQPRRGFNAYKKRAQEVKGASGTDGLFQVPYDVTKVIAFLEAENFDFVDRHWVDTVTDEGKAITVPRNCIASDDVTCPLCGVGLEAKPLALFNVVDLDDPGHVLIWEASSGIFEAIEELANELVSIPEDRGGPLDLCSPGVYAKVSKKKSETKSGKGGFTKYTVARVKERDLDEDHALTPPTEAQFEAMLAHLKTSDDLKFSTREELAELAVKLED